MLKRLSMALVLVLTPIWAMAQGFGAPFYGDSSDQIITENPGRQLQQRVRTLTSYLATHDQVPAEQLMLFLEKEVAPFFDFDRMARWSAGPHGRYMNQTQAELFTAGIRHSFMAAMAQRLAGYPVQGVQFLPPRGDMQSHEVTLSVRVLSSQAFPVQIDFRLAYGDKGWKIYDVAANGSSAVAYYRRMVSTLARQYGVDAMLSRLGG